MESNHRVNVLIPEDTSPFADVIGKAALSPQLLLRPWVLVRSGREPTTSRTGDRRATTEKGGEKGGGGGGEGRGRGGMAKSEAT